MTTVARRAWKRRSDARPGELRTAALRLFAAHGYGRTTIEDIATAAEVTVGTIYRYFRDKEALLHEIVEWATGEPLLSASAPSRPAEPIEELPRLVERLWIGSRKEPHVHLLRILVAESGNAPQLVERYRARVLDPVERALASALRAAGRPDQSLVAARGCLGAVLGASLLSGSSTVPTPIVPQLAPLEALALLHQGLAPRNLPAASPAAERPPAREPVKAPNRPRTPDSW